MIGNSNKADNRSTQFNRMNVTDLSQTLDLEKARGTVSFLKCGKDVGL